jgi:hypothetical protein
MATEIRKATVPDIEFGTGNATSAGGHVGAKVNATHIPFVLGNNALDVNEALLLVSDLRAFLPGGFVTDGSVDYSSQIQAWIDYGIANHLKCVAPTGIFRIDTTITVTDQIDFSIEGNKSSIYQLGTVFKWGGAADGTVFNFVGCRSFNLSNFFVDGNYTAGVGIWGQISGSNAFDSLTVRDVWIMYVQGTPGVALYLGQAATGTGLNFIELTNTVIYHNNEGIRLDGGGGQSIKAFGGLIAFTKVAGVNLKYSGWFNAYDLQMLHNKAHYCMDLASVTVNIFGGYFEYSEQPGLYTGTNSLLNYKNHANGSFLIIGTTHASATGDIPLLIDYEGGEFTLTSIHNNYGASSAHIAAAGGQQARLTSINDTFSIPGGDGWVNDNPYGRQVIFNGNKIKDGPTGTLVWAPGTIANGSGVTSSWIEVDGETAWGDICSVGAPYDLAGITATCYFDNAPARHVVIRLENQTGGNVTLGSGTWKVATRRAYGSPYGL